MTETSIRTSFSTRRLKEVSILFVVMAVPAVLVGWFFLRDQKDFYKTLDLILKISSSFFVVYLVYRVVKVYLDDKKWTQTAILELKRQEKDRSSDRSRVWLYTLLGGLQIGLGLIVGGVNVQIWIGAMFFVQGISFLVSMRLKYQICPQEFWVGEMTRWEDIEKYEWEKDSLWVRRKKSFLRFSDFRIAIDESQKAEGDQILREKVGETGG